MAFLNHISVIPHDITRTLRDGLRPPQGEGCSRVAPQAEGAPLFPPHPEERVARLEGLVATGGGFA